MGSDRSQGHVGGRLRFGAAMAVSAVVHGLLLLALWLAPAPVTPRPPPAGQRPIEVVILEVPPAADREPHPEGGAPASGEVREASAAASPSAGDATIAADEVQSLAVEGIASREDAPPPTPPAGGEAPAQGSSAVAASATGGSPEGSITVVPEEEPRSVDDRFRLPRELDLRAPLAPPPDEPAPAAPQVPEERRIERRLDELFAEDRAVETAKHRADAYWLDLRHRLERGFAPPQELLEAGPGSDSAGMRGAIDSYRAEAAAFGASGTPYGDAPLEPGGRRGFAHEVVDEVATRVFRRPQDVAIGDSSLLSRTLVAVVELEQGADGSLVEARLVSSSGIPAYDRIALGHARDGRVVAAEALGPPPAQGRRTRWAFTSALRIVPPAPIVGCSFDAHFIPQDCFYPLKRFVRHRVRLLAVYDDRRR